MTWRAVGFVSYYTNELTNHSFPLCYWMDGSLLKNNSNYLFRTNRNFLSEEDKNTHSGGRLMEVGAPTVAGGVPRMLDATLLRRGGCCTCRCFDARVSIWDRMGWKIERYIPLWSNGGRAVMNDPMNVLNDSHYEPSGHYVSSLRQRGSDAWW